MLFDAEEINTEQEDNEALFNTTFSNSKQSSFGEVNDGIMLFCVHGGRRQ